jgi:hypothetical protein
VRPEKRYDFSVPVEASKRIDKAEGNSKAQAVSVLYLVELSKEATLNSLMKQLDVEVRLDAMIDRDRRIDSIAWTGPTGTPTLFAVPPGL